MSSGALRAAWEAAQQKQPGTVAPSGDDALMTAFRNRHAKDATEHQGRPFVNATPDTTETSGDRAAGALSAGYQGLTFGLGNKFTAGVRTLLPEALGGVKGFDYDTALREQTGELDRYRDAHPGEATLVELLSGIPSILATGGAGALGEGAEAANVANAASKTSRFGRAALLMGEGAAYGGATGAAEAIRPDATATDVLRGAETGAVIGGVAAPAVSALASPVVRGVTRAGARVFPAHLSDEIASLAGGEPVTAAGQARGALRGALESGGVDISHAAKTAGAVPEIPSRKFAPSEQAITDLMAQKQIGRADALQQLRAAGYSGPAPITPESPTTMMELGSRGPAAVTRAARNVPTSTAAQTTDRFLSERAAGTGKRIESALSDATGHETSDTWLPVEELVAKRAAEAKPLYEQAYAHGDIKDPETLDQISTLRRDPTFARAWRRGQALEALEAGRVSELHNAISPERMKELQDQGLDQFLPKNVSGAPTVKQVDAWKKGLDAVIESGRGSDNALSRSEARVYRQKLNEVLARVDAEVPAYANARASFRGHSELMDAAEAGASHFSPKTPTGALERTLAGLSPSEREAYQSNALNAVAERIRQAAANPDLPEAGRATNIVQRIMGTEDAGQRLGMLFPTEANFEAFLARMEDEALYPKTNQFLRNQSSTKAQLAEGAVSPGAWADLAKSPFSNGARLRLLGKAASNALESPGLSKDVADQIGDQATATGQRLRDILSQMQADKAAREIGRTRLSRVLTGAASETEAERRPFKQLPPPK